ncbi:hypothetical protein D8674_000672 [Pyrus ussuriensis x Pyrus communis]|uniref:Uncharacterized protein n=1 Tax=Pyrus ussuriensis x Pyrus communis TaxID=2448454 RepID=A0A5N5F961_9ROSA|nr:hypothetical protein D8674_000672 [Pyrus ussuriensis x Pyrus communis]
MSIRERCLMMEWVIYGKEDLHELQVEYEDMWEHLKELSERAKKVNYKEEAGSSSQGGGGWPSIIARLP